MLGQDYSKLRIAHLRPTCDKRAGGFWRLCFLTSLKRGAVASFEASSGYP